MEPDLFEIKLNDKGKILLLRINSWAKFLYICTMITCVFDLINAYIGFWAYKKFLSSSIGIIKFQTQMNIIFLAIYAIALPVQAYLFYRFSTRSRKALLYENSEDFNDSFRWLLKHAMVASFLFALNSLWAILVTYSEIKMASLYNNLGN